MDAVRLAEHVHGHAGWLAAALLVHPAIALRNRTRRAHLAVGLATALVTVVGAAGGLLYVEYRARLKADIFQHAPTMGLLFERKEHLAFGSIVLAWAGAAAYLAALRADGDLHHRLRTIAFHAYCASAALAVVVAVLGTIVASYRTF